MKAKRSLVGTVFLLIFSFPVPGVSQETYNFEFTWGSLGTGNGQLSLRRAGLGPVGWILHTADGEKRSVLEICKRSIRKNEVEHETNKSVLYGVYGVDPCIGGHSLHRLGATLSKI